MHSGGQVTPEAESLRVCSSSSVESTATCRMLRLQHRRRYHVYKCCKQRLELIQNAMIKVILRKNTRYSSHYLFENVPDINIRQRFLNTLMIHVDKRCFLVV